MERKPVVFFSPKFDLRDGWDYTTPYTKGIGGSEANHIELSSALKKLGHDVISYAPIPEDLNGTYYKDVQWYSDRLTDVNREGVWLIYRTLSLLDYINKKPNQKLCIFLHDVTIEEDWTESRANKVDKIFVLCKKHAWFLGYLYPQLKEKIHVMKSGIDVEKINKLLPEKRDPYKLIWPSCPSRGLYHLLDIFIEAQEFVPQLSLDIFYGYDNLDLTTRNNQKLVKKIEKFSKYEGITYHGKSAKDKVWEAFMQSGIWCYPSMYLEVFCMAAVEAQCLGAIPIVHPIWGVGENVHYGNWIMGNPYEDPLIKARFVESIIAFATNHKLQEEIRIPMMQRTREMYNWDTVAKEWSEVINGL